MTLYTRHGFNKTPEYKTWCYMKTRCYNPNCRSYHHYGGRGIRVCDQWINDFKAFYDYIGPRPSDKHSIDRIDNDGHYEPGNVRWATAEEQARNRGSSQANKKIKLPSGEVLTIMQICDRYDVTPSIIYSRLRFNLPLERPVCHTAKYIYKGQELTIPEIAAIEQVSDYQLRYHSNRFKKQGMEIDIEDIVIYLKRNYSDGKRLDIGLTHGMKRTTEYHTWIEYKTKCYNPNDKSYKDWGAKGVIMCDRWRYSFPNFYDDLGPKPTPEHRIKVNDKSKPLDINNVSWSLP